MREYLTGLFVLGVCCCVVELISPAGEGGGIARHIKLMSGLCLLCTLLSPFLWLLQNGETLPEQLKQWVDEWSESGEDTQQDYTDRWQAESEQMDIAYAEQTVASMLQQQFSLAERSCRVEICLNTDHTSIREMRVALSGQAIWINTHDMENYIQTTFGCASTIYIE